MLVFRRLIPLLAAVAVLAAQSEESFAFNVEWRLITAGRAEMNWKRSGAGYTTQLKLYSSGLVSRLFKVNDIYDSSGTAELCAQQTRLQAEEGNRKRDTLVRWTPEKSFYLEKDLLKNETILSKELDIQGCVHDVLGALARLRGMTNLQPGQSATVPLSDGKKLVQARIEAQEKERISTKIGTFNTIRYEAFVFNDILFKRNARLLIWISDDARRLPLQVQVRMRIHIGTVTFVLDKVEPPTETSKK